MSFGYRDQDWVDPPDEEPVHCRECSEWEPCPCGCGSGWCRREREFTDEGDEC